MAPELRAYAEKLDATKVGRVILFTTSNWSRRTVYAHMLHINGRVEAAREFGRKKLIEL